MIPHKDTTEAAADNAAHPTSKYDSLLEASHNPAIFFPIVIAITEPYSTLPYQ
jgi:hypothetical protein